MYVCICCWTSWWAKALERHWSMEEEHIMDSHGLCNWYSQPTPRFLNNSYSSQCWPTLRFLLILYVGRWSAQPMCSDNEMHVQDKEGQPSWHAPTPKCMRNMRRVGQADQLQMCRVEHPCYQESDRLLYLQSAQFSLLGRASYLARGYEIDIY